jgi:saposin
MLYVLFTQCITLVDYYSSIFFPYASSVQSEDFCRKFNLCQEMKTFSAKRNDDSCSICQRAVSEVLVKLKDPDTQVCIWLLANHKEWWL